MIKLSYHHVRQVQVAETLEDLLPLVQNAIMLEHATIPTYLTAMFSLKPKTNREIWEIIHTVVIEEMLHMSIASNIMNALGGSPSINSAEFVPKYPTALPMGIGSGDGLTVTLQKYSKNQVKEVFMEIEEPETPLDLEVKSRGAEPEYATIGQFYDALKEKILKLAPPILPGDPQKQVTSKFFPDYLLFPILTPQNAADAIDIIVEQGEGQDDSPVTQFDFEKEISHYYRFEELYYGKRLVKDPDAKYGYSYSGPDIPFSEEDVWNLYPINREDESITAMLPEGSEQRVRMDEFNASYRSLLDGLHHTFNGAPHHLDATIGIMYDIKLYAEKLCGTIFPATERGEDGKLKIKTYENGEVVPRTDGGGNVYYIPPSFEFIKEPTATDLTKQKTVAAA